MRRSMALLFALAVPLALLSGCLGGPASEWASEMTGITTLQDRGLTGTGVTIAIVDTGYNPDHPSLDHARIVAWKDFVSGRAEPYDDVGHGSHVAGILVGKGGSAGAKWQGFNLRGAAPDASLIIVKAIGADGTGDSTAVADGVRFATQNRADILCLSLGSRSNPVNQFIGDDLTNAVNAAVNAGILVVAAAGNTGEDPNRNDVESPATIEGVIGVGAVDEQQRLASFSARGNDQQNHGFVPGNELTAPRKDPSKKPELVAPGVEIKSAWKGNDYAVAKGTSQAAPFVCGALALVLQSKPSLRNVDSSQLTTQVKTALMQSAQKLSGQQQPHDNVAGYGLLRADQLLGRL